MRSSTSSPGRALYPNDLHSRLVRECIPLPTDAFAYDNPLVQDESRGVPGHIDVALDQWQGNLQHPSSRNATKRAQTIGKKYTCVTCNTAFTQNKSFLRHLRSKHGSQKFVCSICHATYSREDMRKRHEEETHGDLCVKINCEFCGRRVARRFLPEHKNSRICHQYRVLLLNKVTVRDSFRSQTAEIDPLVAALELYKFWDPIENPTTRYKILAKAKQTHTVAVMERRTQYLHQKSVALRVLSAHISAYTPLDHGSPIRLKLSLSALALAILEGFGKDGILEESYTHLINANRLLDRKPKIGIMNIIKPRDATTQTYNLILWEKDSAEPSYQHFEQVISGCGLIEQEGGLPHYLVRHMVLRVGSKDAPLFRQRNWRFCRQRKWRNQHKIMMRTSAR